MAQYQVFDIFNLSCITNGDYITKLTLDRNQKISKNVITLQLYTVEELGGMLEKNGFKALEYSGIDGAKFSETKTERILMVARKQ